jgi:DNA polymerase-1
MPRVPGAHRGFAGAHGDSSDNIPGIPKVGPKTAAKWLNDYGSLDALIARADEIKGKVGESLRASLDTLALSRQLATIHCDVELVVGPRDLRPGEANIGQLRNWYTRLEFSRWLGELDAHRPNEPAWAHTAPQTDYATVITQAQLESWLSRLQAAELFAFDTETTSLNLHGARIVGVSFAVKAGEAPMSRWRMIIPAPRIS